MGSFESCLISWLQKAPGLLHVPRSLHCLLCFQLLSFAKNSFHAEFDAAGIASIVFGALYALLNAWFLYAEILREKMENHQKQMNPANRNE